MLDLVTRANDSPCYNRRRSKYFRHECGQCHTLRTALAIAATTRNAHEPNTRPREQSNDCAFSGLPGLIRDLRDNRAFNRLACATGSVSNREAGVIGGYKQLVSKFCALDRHRNPCSWFELQDPGPRGIGWICLHR
jgi:hypothetical protein